MNNNYPFAPSNVVLLPEYINKLKNSINFAMNGKTNNTGEVTITPSTSSTTVLNNLCNVNSVVILSPVTSHAAVHDSGRYVVAGDKQFTIHHSNSAQTDKTYRYVIIG